MIWMFFLALPLFGSFFKAFGLMMEKEGVFYCRLLMNEE